jgi:hypothetical protein
MLAQTYASIRDQRIPTCFFAIAIWRTHSPRFESFRTFLIRLVSTHHPRSFASLLNQFHDTIHRDFEFSDCRKFGLFHHRIPRNTRYRRSMSSGTKLPPPRRRTVLITGCSPNSLGHSLALALHARGLRVFATARDPTKLQSLRDKGIECFRLDVCDGESIRESVESVRDATRDEDGGGRGEEGRLDILVNNAGGGKSSLFSVTRFVSLPLAGAFGRVDKASERRSPSTKDNYCALTVTSPVRARERCRLSSIRHVLAMTRSRRLIIFPSARI